MTLSLPHNSGPAIGLLDIDDIPTALLAFDALIKEAPVRRVASGSVQPGRWLTLFDGEVEAVHMAYKKGVDTAASHLVDSLFLPYAEPRLIPALLSATVYQPHPGDTLLVLQSKSTPTLIKALDAALKGADVSLMQLRAARGLGGQAFSTLWGHTSDAEAAEALALALCPQLSTQLIRNADPEVALALASGSQFFGA